MKSLREYSEAFSFWKECHGNVVILYLFFKKQPVFENIWYDNWWIAVEGEG